jgi:hypothetical protein
MRKITRHLTYANVMSTLAVFMLLGAGGAVAAKKQTKKIGTTQLKASAVTTGKIKNGAVIESKLRAAAVTNAKLAEGSVTNGKLVDGSVTGNKIAPDAVTGDKVVEATLSEVPAANSANPLAFAKVDSNGVVDGGFSKGITSLNVSRPATGVYCVSVPSFTPRGGHVTTQFGGTGGTTAQLNVGGTGNCPFPSVQVLTWTTGPTAAANIGFLISLYR